MNRVLYALIFIMTSCTSGERIISNSDVMKIAEDIALEKNTSNHISIEIPLRENIDDQDLVKLYLKDEYLLFSNSDTSITNFINSTVINQKVFVYDESSIFTDFFLLAIWFHEEDIDFSPTPTVTAYFHKPIAGKDENFIYYEFSETSKHPPFSFIVNLKRDSKYLILTYSILDGIAKYF